jgi:predicted esterase
VNPFSETDPHGGIPELRSGTPLAVATHALILLHGRGATAESILPLADHLGLPDSTHRTAVFLGCSDRDPHIPLSRVKETEEIFILKGYEVDCRIYPGMGHTINGDELSAARQLISRIFS